jgi:hypothetical protein
VPGPFRAARTHSAGARGWVGCAVQALGDLGEIEAQAPFRAAEPDAAELVGVGVDPVALDVQQPSELGGVDQALARLRGCR